MQADTLSYHELAMERNSSKSSVQNGTRLDGAVPVAAVAAGSGTLHIAILYDASYLIESDKIRPYSSKYAGAHTTHVVPEEVKGELRQLLDDPNRRDSAGNCQANIAALMEHDEHTEYWELELQKLATPISWDHSLGTDSWVGQLLVGYAKTVLENDEYTHVIIATCDGGIALDVKKLRQEMGLPVYTLSPRDDIKNLPPMKEVRKLKERDSKQAAMWHRVTRWLLFVGATAAAAAGSYYSFESYPIASVLAGVVLLILFAPALVEMYLQRKDSKF